MVGREGEGGEGGREGERGGRMVVGMGMVMVMVVVVVVVMGMGMETETETETVRILKRVFKIHQLRPLRKEPPPYQAFPPYAPPAFGLPPLPPPPLFINPAKNDASASFCAFPSLSGVAVPCCVLLTAAPFSGVPAPSEDDEGCFSRRTMLSASTWMPPILNCTGPICSLMRLWEGLLAKVKGCFAVVVPVVPVVVESDWGCDAKALSSSALRRSRTASWDVRKSWVLREGISRVWVVALEVGEWVLGFGIVSS